MTPPDFIAPLRKQLSAASDALLIKDAQRLQSQLRRATKRFDQDRFLRDLERAQQRAQQREAAIPSHIDYPPELPVSQARAELRQAIEQHQVIVVCGETGSGKTTQLPKLCLELGRGQRGLIGHTQPRRLAARSVASRIAKEMGSPLGALVGFETRFDRRLSAQSLIKLMTDGILLAELQRDRNLLAYDTLIIDEAHERSLNIDFLLGWLKRLVRKRPELKLIITSATLDPEKLAEHFRIGDKTDVPIIQVSGRTYPVEMRYRAPEQDGDLEASVATALQALWRERGASDSLVFLPGEREIHDLCRSLPGHFPKAQILPLYSRLPSSQQDRVFSSGGPPRIVLSTNVAETSVTVPGIRYVVDVGTARLSRWSARLGIQQLQIEPVSQAAAKQRAGRCGRTGPGVCVRLYEQDDFDSRDPFTDPEIRRANLAGVILRMLALRLGDVERFDWLDAPNQKQVSAAYRLLQTLGALDENRQLSKLGIELARLPLDPRVGRIALAARGQACADEVFVLAAALSVQDPHDHPPESIATARQKHAQWRHRRSDFLTLLQLWRQWQGWSAESSNRQLRKRCREHFVSYRRMEEWEAVYRQILDLLGASPPKKPNDDPVDDLFAPIHQALLAGLVDHIGHKAPEKTEFVGPRGRKFRVFPGSALAKKPPPWIMCGTMVHTSQVFARSCARIDPDWLMQVAPHLVKRTQLAPVWDRQRGEVTCTEYRSIFGLSLGSVKRHYGSTDPDAAREIFIDHALVRGEMNNKPAFLRHNRELLSQVHEKEVRLRRPELAVDERQQYDWYAQRLPPRICTVAALKRWLHRGGNTAGLSMNEADALRDEAETDLDQQFPSQVQINAHRIRLSYAHEPGQDQDGVSFHIPLPLLFQLPATRFDWLVPGLLPARIEALIRSLPHKIRRHCTPAAHYAEVLCDRMSPDEGDLHAAICRHFLDMTGLRIAPEDFAPEKLESHLCPRLILEQEDGASIAVASSLDNLQTRHRKTFRQQLSHWCEVEPKLAQWTRPNVSNWDFGDLPDVLHSPGGAQLYPALTQVGENIVTLALHETRDAANAAHTQGLRQLLLRKCRERRKDMLRTARDQLGFALLNTVHTADSLVAACCHRAADQIWNLSQIRAAADFESALEKRAEFGHLAAALLFQSCDYLLTAAEIRKRLRSLGEAYSQAQADIRAQLESLLPEAFPMLVPGPQWKRLPLYLKAMQVRLERLINKPAKDQQLFEKLKPFQARLPHPMHPARWVMEEWRIFLFAQELRAQGSPGPDKVEAALTD